MAAPELHSWPRRKALRWLLHTTVLFAAMAAPFLLLDIETASPVTAGAGFAYISLWLAFLIIRDWGRSKLPAKINLLYLIYGVSIPFAVYGVMFFSVVEWAMWAYRPLTSPAETWAMFTTALIVIAAILIYPPVLFLLFAPLLARKDGGPASRFLEGVRARGFGWFQANWLSNTMGVAGMVGLGAVLTVPLLLYGIEHLRDNGDGVTGWELVAAYPTLPFALPAIAAILVLSIILIPDRNSDEAAVRAYVDGAAEEQRPNRGTRIVLGWLTAGACVAGLLLFIYPIHLGMTAKGVRDGRTALHGVIEATGILRNTHEDDDWTNAEFATELNRFGYWNPDEPEAGLGSLVADPGKAFPETCTVRVAAGTIDPPAAGDAEPEMRYCVAVACAPPFT